MNITETISLLDELRRTCTQGEWFGSEWETDNPRIGAPSNTHLASFFWPSHPPTKEGERKAEEEIYSTVDYIVTLHNNYEALRKAALDGERYRKAGDVFSFIRAQLWNTDDNKPIDSQGRELKHTIQQWLCHVEDAYRQAVEQKEV